MKGRVVIFPLSLCFCCYCLLLLFNNRRKELPLGDRILLILIPSNFFLTNDSQTFFLNQNQNGKKNVQFSPSFLKFFSAACCSLLPSHSRGAHSCFTQNLHFCLFLHQTECFFFLFFSFFCFFSVRLSQHSFSFNEGKHEASEQLETRVCLIS